jgi:hypothetical protein
MSPKSNGGYRNIIQDDKKPSNERRPKCRTSSKFTRTTRVNSGSGSKPRMERTLFASERYKTKLSAKKTIDSIKKNAADADVDEQG